MSLRNWFRTKRALIHALEELNVASRDLRQEYNKLIAIKDRRYAEHQLRYDRLLTQYENLIGYPLGALESELADLKRELGILKSTEDINEARLELLLSFKRVKHYIMDHRPIPYQEMERVQEWIERLQAAQQELQQWTGAGTDERR